MFEGWSRIMFEFYLAEHVLGTDVKGWQCAYDPLSSPDDDPRSWFDAEHFRWSPLTDPKQALQVLGAAIVAGWDTNIKMPSTTLVIEVALEKDGTRVVGREIELCNCICSTVARAFLSIPPERKEAKRKAKDDPCEDDDDEPQG